MPELEHESPTRAQDESESKGGVDRGGPVGSHRVTATLLNFRREPVRAVGNVIRTLAHGSVVQVLGRAPNGYYRVYVGDTAGFVHGAYLDHHAASGMAAVDRIAEEMPRSPQEEASLVLPQVAVATVPPPSTLAVPAKTQVAPVVVDTTVSHDLVETPVPPVADYTAWLKPELFAIQSELKRIGVYSSLLDGVLGPLTRSALVEAFGSDEWQRLPAGDVLGRLSAATPLSTDRTHRRVRFGELFKDGVLDITVGCGFAEEDEDDAATQLDAYTLALQEKGFRIDNGAATTILAGTSRGVGAASIGSFFVKENAITYAPPAGVARPIHAVVRLLRPTDGTGKQVADAFRDGMLHSDAAFYAGHGRYGSGPDFDRNISFEVHDKDGSWRHVDDYEVLEHELKASGDPWTVFTARVAQGRIKVNLSNDGNVFLNKDSHHSNEFGGKLMYWALAKTGKQLETGKNGALAQSEADAKYKIWVFDGCRTMDYERALRDTPGQDKAHTDIVQTNKTVSWTSAAPHVVAFLQSLIDQTSAEHLVRNMNTSAIAEDAHGFQATGFAAGTAVL